MLKLGLVDRLGFLSEPRCPPVKVLMTSNQSCLASYATHVSEFTKMLNYSCRTVSVLFAGCVLLKP